MASIHVFRRKRKGNDGKEITDKIFSAQIRFGRNGPAYLRSTGKTERREAQIEARRIARVIQDEELPKRGKDILTIDVMISKWLSEHGSKLRSLKDIEWQLKRILDGFGRETPAADVGTKALHAFVQDRKAADDGAAAINRCLTTFRSIIRYAALRWEEPLKTINWKTHFLKEPKIREVYLSPEEARRLIDLLPMHIALAVAFSLYTGTRLDEMASLTWDRIDWSRGAAEVITKAEGEEPVMRTIWLSAKAVSILMTCRDMWPTWNEEWKGKKPDPNIVFNLRNRRKLWEAARKAIGRTDVHFHDLRGMTATWARQFAKADITLISAGLGHSGTDVTRRYTRVVDQEIVKMLEQLPDVFDKPSHGATRLLQSSVAIHPQEQNEIVIEMGSKSQ